MDRDASWQFHKFGYLNHMAILRIDDAIGTLCDTMIYVTVQCAIYVMLIKLLINQLCTIWF